MSRCPDCRDGDSLPRRDFIRVVGAGAAAAAIGGVAAPLFGADEAAKPAATNTPETLVQQLYGTLKENQKKEVCFDWDFMDPQRGLLRTRVSNNWHITKPEIKSDYYTKDQQQLMREIWEGLIHPDWHKRVDQQLEDDAGGWGIEQNIAIFGKPGDGKFELVMTGRHMTIRVDGNSTEHLAFGGPIFYGHAAGGFNEKADHKNNVYWEQALLANKVYEALDGKQRAIAAVASSPREQDSGFRGQDGKRPGIPVTELASDQKELVQKTLQKLIEPYRQNDRDEVLACLKKQGGLDACSLAFFTDQDIGNDKVWDNWRLEGPSFVWYFRGNPHVHVWVHVADDASVKINA